MIPIDQLILVLCRLVFGAVFAFLGILLWSRTRSVSWMLIIIGAIVQYGQIMVSTFTIFGIVSVDRISIRGVPIVEIVLTSLPYLLYAAGLVAAIRENRLR